MSRGVETSCSPPASGGRPWTERKRVSLIPSSAARAFMRSTIASQDPATCSAMATAASFALWIMSA